MESKKRLVNINLIKLHLQQNKTIKPIIVYDPKNKFDHRYVCEEVNKAFPNAILLKTPYSGHGVAPYLSETGQLKSVVTSFLNNEVPIIAYKQRVRCFRYYRNLAKVCLDRNKLSWAYHLINERLELNPDDKLAIKGK